MRILISNNLSTAQFVHVSEAATVKQVWDNLKAVHEHHGQQSILTIRRTLYQSCVQDGDDIVAHLMTLRSLQVQLHHMGSKVPDQDFTNILLSSLPKSWDSFTTSYLGSQTGANVLTSQQFIAIIHDECNRQKAANGGTSGTETVLTAQSPKHPAKGKKAVEKEKKKACFTCGRNNHLTKDCFFRGKPKCTNCGCFNHETSECRSTGKGKEKESETTITESVPTQNEKHRKVERAQQAHNVQDDEEMEDGMYVTQNERSSDCADIDVNSWLADSAASSHLLNLRNAFLEFTPLSKTIRGVGNTEVPVKGRGTIKLKGRTEPGYTIVLRDVLYVPWAPNNLFSISCLDESGSHVNMGDGRIHLYDKNKNLIAVGWKVERMYLLNIAAHIALERAALSTEMANTWLDWHRRFGHIGVSGLQRTLHKHLVTGMTVSDDNSPRFDCDACVQAKQARAPFLRQSENRAERPGDLTHMDLWECHMTGIHGVRYFILFIDDCSRCIAVKFLKTKDRAIEKFQNYVAYLERQYSMSPKCFHADNGGEYIMGDLQWWCTSKGIRLEYTAPHSPAKNGVAERMNCTLAELARAMIFSTQVPKFLWPEAISHAAYLCNRTHMRALDLKMPLEAWCGYKPDISHLREFGSPVWILNEGQLTKLQPRSTKHTFVGFMDGPKAIKYYDVSLRQVRVSCNYQFPALSASQMNANTHTTLPQENPAQSEGEATPIRIESGPENPDTHLNESKAESRKRKQSDAVPDGEVRQSARQKKMHDYRLLDDPWADDDETSMTTGTISSEMANMTSTERVYAASSEPNVAPDNPKNLREARDSPDWPNWEKAIKAELDQLHKMGTWELVYPPEGHTPIPNKWVLTKKYDKEGNLLKYKARLVAKGYSQQPGMDYTDTFSPVMRLETIWTLLAWAVAEDWEIQQMDVKGAYLNGTIKEEIYMRQPEGYNDGTGCWCHLIKSLYGLKQARREWNNELNKQLDSLGWMPTIVDPCAYARRSTEGIEVIAVWVDNLLLFASNKSLMKKIKFELESIFDITDLGEPAKIIGIEIDRDHAK